MSNSFGDVSRRRMMQPQRCADPVLYVSDNSSTYSPSNFAKDGKMCSINPVYLFVYNSVDNCTFKWSITIYNANGTTYASDSGTNSIGIESKHYGSGRGYIIPTGGSYRLEGEISKPGFTTSNVVSYRMYLTKQTIEVIMDTSDTTPYYREINITSNYPYSSLIYYNMTTGSEPATPTTSSTLYTNPFTITSTKRIKAKAFPATSGEYYESSPVDRTYTITQPALTAPSLSLASGTYTTAQLLSMRNENSYGNIYYTVDGTTPTTSSILYLANENIPITETCTVKAAVIEPVSNVSSPVTTRNYTISSAPIITTTVTDITGDSAIVHGTLTYDTSVYPVPYETSNPRKCNVFGFYIRKGYETPENYIVYVRDTDFSLYTQNDNIATVTFEHCIDGLGQNEPVQVQGISTIYYRDINGHIQYRSIGGQTINFNSLSVPRGQYSIMSGNIEGWMNGVDPYSGSVHDNDYFMGTISLKILFSPVNLSFQSNHNTPNTLKRWGGMKNELRYGHDYYNSQQGIWDTFYDDYNTQTTFLRSPWDYIGSSTWDYMNSSMSNLLSYNNLSGRTERYKDVRDLFGWGTSYNTTLSPSHTNPQPWAISTTDADYNPYGSLSRNLRDTRSGVWQMTPDEGAFNYQNSPCIFEDWGTALAGDVYMIHGSVYIPYWALSNQSSQYSTTVQWDPRSYGLMSSESEDDYAMVPHAKDKVGTLSSDEWSYLLFSRSGNRFAKGRIQAPSYYGHTQYTNGLFIFSDNTPSNIISLFSSINSASVSFSTNTITDAQWRSDTYHFENYVTFLPAAGYRDGISYSGDNAEGYYWSRTYYNNSNAMCLHFNKSSVELTNVPRSRGCSVRLVRFTYLPISN